jgi:hypothetical protein
MKFEYLVVIPLYEDLVNYPPTPLKGGYESDLVSLED